MADNLSAVLYGKRDLRMEQRRIPTIATPDQLLIRIHTTGICGSDVHLLDSGQLGPLQVKESFILGHEASGVVEEVGANATSKFSKGDRVAIEGGVPCSHCLTCTSGRYNLCPKLTFFAEPPLSRSGTLTRFITHPAHLCYKLPENVTMEEGVLVEPLAVAVHAVRRSDLKYGQKVLVCGAGPSGLLHLLAAKAMVSSLTVIVTDISDKRLAVAKQIGADYVLNVDKLTPKEAAAKIEKLMGEPEVTFDCTLKGTSAETAILATKCGGIVVLVGLGAPRMDVPLSTVTTKEIDLRGSWRYANDYPTAVNLIASGRVNTKTLTCAHYPLEKSLEAFKMAMSGEVIKVFIDSHQ